MDIPEYIEEIFPTEESQELSDIDSDMEDEPKVHKRKRSMVEDDFYIDANYDSEDPDAECPNIDGYEVESDSESEESEESEEDEHDDLHGATHSNAPAQWNGIIHKQHFFTYFPSLTQFISQPLTNLNLTKRRV